MRLTLCQLFNSMSGDGKHADGTFSAGMFDAGPGDTGSAETGNTQGELFDETDKRGNWFSEPDEADIAVITALHSSAGIDIAVLPPNARRLFELSVNTLEAIVHAWMSEFPITAEIIRFGQKTLAAADMGNRLAADTAATNRSDPDVQAVLEAAYKVWHETNRLLGLLRFYPDEDGVYIALCEPDHFTLPALGPHFRERFGQTPWAIIDIKRRLCMRCSNQSLELSSIDKNPAFPENPPNGEWENLWRHYHKTINNESRNNPDLQRRFMPKRYWKYLTERQ